MNFLYSLPQTVKNCDTLWVIMDRLTKLAHFILIRLNYQSCILLKKLEELYIEKIISLHGIPSNIVSDRDLRFTLRFWESLQKVLGTKLYLSFAYHPQTDG